MSTHRINWVLLLLLTTMWGSAFMLTKIAVSAYPPKLIVCGRLVIAAIFLCGLLVLQKHSLPKSLQFWSFVLIIALLGNIIPFWLISWGQQTVDSGLAGILMAMVPLVTLVTAHFVLPGEKLNTHRIGGFILGFSGVVILTGPSVLMGLHGENAEILAMLAILGGAAGYGIASVIARLHGEFHPIISATGMSLMASLVMLPIVFSDKQLLSSIVFDNTATYAVIGLGVFCTAVPTIIYFRLITSAGPHFVSFLNYLIPLWAVVLGVSLLGEQITLLDVIALLVIFSGITFARREDRPSR